MKILVCEDEEILLTSLQFRLKKQGFDIIIAKDGKDALEKIKTESPDLVVADIMMPSVSGLELITFIRKKMKSKMPVIIISALGNDEMVLKAFELGATDFISKPFKPSELVLRIKMIFQEMAIVQ
ncbi:MAG TPA: response regulator transcription factor [Phaeodactylibacter sp.]|nr:response regulator transcription factor [Phaeodactylibacter sp.]